MDFQLRLVLIFVLIGVLEGSFITLSTGGVQLVPRGVNVIIVCAAPESYSKIEWFKNGKRIDRDRVPRSGLAVRHGRLYMMHATRHDQGRYECATTDSHHVTSRTPPLILKVM